MPNWTHCRLEAPTDVLKKYLAKDKDGETFFDFNLVIPQPEIYKDPTLTEGFDTDWCIYWYLTNRGTVMAYGYSIKLFEFGNSWSAKAREYCEAKSDECYERGRKYAEVFKKYGYRSWFYWNRHNWGTKWNASETVVDDDLDDFYYVEFDTAWSYPKPVIDKIFADNSGCDITFEWQDEGDEKVNRISRDSKGHWTEKHEWDESEEGDGALD